MKRLTTLLMTLMLMSMMVWADQTVTVSANSSDISEGLDLKVVAKLFAEAKNLEEFESMLNNPDSAFCNLDLNGDGQVDYLRVVETGEGNKRLIVLQAILAKDIYQDVASIYVEKDEKDEVSVQVVGDEYVYGKNYIIEPVYVYRPLIYDWFWGSSWYAWHSPWYWGYWPGWWYSHSCWARDWYWRHCYAFHHHHHWCSFRPGRQVHHGYHDLHSGVTRRDFATAHPEHSFSQRNSGMTNARDFHKRGGSGVTARPAATVDRGSTFSRTFDSRNTAVSSRSTGTSNRPGATSGRSTGTASRPASTTDRFAGSTRTVNSGATTRTAATGSATRTTGTIDRSAHNTDRLAGTTRTTSTSATTRTTTSGSTTRPTSSGSTTRTVSTTATRPSSSYSTSTSRTASTQTTRSSYSGSSNRSSSYSGSSSRSGSYSGSSSRSSGSSFSSGGSRSGGSSSGVTRR